MAKKRKLKMRNGFRFAIILALLFYIGSFTYLRILNKNVPFYHISKVQSTGVEIPKIKTYKLSMIMAGDALMHGYLNTDAKQSDGTYNYMNQFRYVKDYVKDYDLRYWNQETIFGGSDRAYSGYPRFNTPSALGDNLIDDMGFNIVSTANNHSMDQNTSGVLNSVAYWKT